MFKIARKAWAAAAVTASLLVATPASAGTAIFYYYDYPGGTPAGYEVYCGSIYYSWGEKTGIFYVGPWVYC